MHTETSTVETFATLANYLVREQRAADEIVIEPWPVYQMGGAIIRQLRRRTGSDDMADLTTADVQRARAAYLIDDPADMYGLWDGFEKLAYWQTKGHPAFADSFGSPIHRN